MIRLKAAIDRWRGVMKAYDKDGIELKNGTFFQFHRLDRNGNYTKTVMGMVWEGWIHWSDNIPDWKIERDWDVVRDAVRAEVVREI